MAAISQTIGNVLGGMSAQPDSVKIPGQVRHATNVYLDPTFGCTKRQGTEFIANLGTDIPEDAKWFPIFRDNDDRFLVCSYKSGTSQILRVFTGDTGEERTVTMEGSSADYIAVNDVSNLRPLTVNDYTFLVNAEKAVLMNEGSDEVADARAVVVVNQVAYNTTYAVDFLRDGEELSQVKVDKASRISVSPASFDVLDDEGACSDADIANFVVDSDTSDATGLGFRLEATCNPTLVTEKVEGAFYPTRMNGYSPAPGVQYGRQVWGYIQHGSADQYAEGSYLYSDHYQDTPSGSIDYRVECQVSYGLENADGSRRAFYTITGVNVLDYTIGDAAWSAGMTWVDGGTTTQNIVVNPLSGAITPAGSTYGITIEIIGVQQADESTKYSYKSAYKVRTSLNNGGQNWAVGDTVTVTMLDREYTITVEETTFGYSYESEASASYTTAADTEAGALNVNDVVSNIVSEVQLLDDYNARPVGNVIIIERTDGRDFNLMTRGGTANSALYGLKDAVNDVSLLPPQCEDGVLLRVSNSDQSDADDYYVRFKTEGGIPGQGAWEETVKPNIPTDLNPATMPHALIRETDGTFVVRPLTEEYDDENFWQPRKVGDKTTNPAPTFVNKPIQDAFFYQNRLGFLSEDTVVMSQAGDYFNFFQGSAIAISDADPIDMSTSTTRPAKLKSAIGTPAGLLLFAENSQFLMKSQDVAFGPSTVKIDEVSSFAYKSTIHPVETGVSILFTTESTTYTKVYELATDSLNSRPQTTDNTRVVPEFIPPNLTHIASVPNQSMVLFGTGNNIIYVFKFFNSGNERQLAGWTTWDMSCDIKLMAFDHDTGFLIGRNGDNTLILKLEMLDDPDTAPINALGTRFMPRLDHWIDESDATFVDLEDGDVKVYIPDGIAAPDSTLYLAATYEGSETFYVEGDLQTDEGGDYFTVSNRLSQYDVIIGVGYEMRVELPSFFVKEENRSDRRNPPMVENVYINVFMSGRYDCEVAHKGYVTRTVPLEVVIADIYEADTASIQEDGIRAIGVYGRGDLTKLTITADGPLPAALTSYSWEGHYSTRGIARR